MKKIIALGCLSLFTANLAYALPANLTEQVYLKSYMCGGDSCYLDIELANIQAVSISTFCGDRKYCTQYDNAYEKITAQNEYDGKNEPKYEIDRKAKVTLKLVDNPYSGEKMYETTSITYLKE